MGASVDMRTAGRLWPASRYEEQGDARAHGGHHRAEPERVRETVDRAVLDAPLGGTLADAVARLADSDDLRESLITAARAWVAGIRTNPEILALRNVVARELHRFPELGEGWHDAGPERHHPAVAGALRQLVAQDRLDVPDIEVAVLQLYSLLVFPYLVLSAYGTDVDDGLTDRLITGGVDMFLGHYAPRHTEP
ncbi:TetR/AcrR family transcriptional regulator C-terminal domain-containing protein [Streptomyces mirabilis]|uniref:TetR/AcrR family transcriptional regulator C-terminal domain-containing protein n=1 Tax=Streptomyces mirabilis TaxID=68239 RepID=UPI0036408D67